MAAGTRANENAHKKINQKSARLAKKAKPLKKGQQTRVPAIPA